VCVFPQQAGSQCLARTRRAMEQDAVAGLYFSLHLPAVKQLIIVLQPCFYLFDPGHRLFPEYQVVPAHLRGDAFSREIAAEFGFGYFPGGK